ncbi:MAG: hypothetical protein Q7U37_11040 [Gallionella sp.]|nr:hypothetical protein [Gallionella sp.]MDP1941706.1 hypothetical protein [Gallionella sp.]
MIPIPAPGALPSTRTDGHQPSGIYTPPTSNALVIDLAQSGDTDQSRVAILAASLLFFPL